MTPSLESTEQSDLSTQELPEIPTVQDMRQWNKEKVLRWIQKRDENILQDDDLEKFNKAHIAGRAFIAGDAKFYEKCGLPPGVGLALEVLADEVRKGGKFIPRT